MNMPAISFTHHLGQKLSTREKEVLYFSTRGKTARGIADTLGLSSRTIEHHLKNIKKKLGISKKADLIEMTIDYFK